MSLVELGNFLVTHNSVKIFYKYSLKVISALYASKFGPSFETCSQIKKCMAFGDCPPDMIDMLFPGTLLNILEEK